jgi:hypothetical protein
MFKNRIKTLLRVDASTLRPNPRNWRNHPEPQKNALRAILAEIGLADALLARELPDGSLELVDGHLRAETLPGTMVPVLVLDVSESEANRLLATHDPLSEMAGADKGKLHDLFTSIDTDSGDLHALLEQTAASAGVNLETFSVDASSASAPIRTCPECGHSFPVTSTKAGRDADT